MNGPGPRWAKSQKWPSKRPGPGQAGPRPKLIPILKHGGMERKSGQKRIQILWRLLMTMTPLLVTWFPVVRRKRMFIQMMNSWWSIVANLEVLDFCPGLTQHPVATFLSFHWQGEGEEENKWMSTSKNIDDDEELTLLRVSFRCNNYLLLRFSAWCQNGVVNTQSQSDKRKVDLYCTLLLQGGAVGKWVDYGRQFERKTTGGCFGATPIEQRASSYRNGIVPLLVSSWGSLTWCLPSGL